MKCEDCPYYKPCYTTNYCEVLDRYNFVEKKACALVKENGQINYAELLFYQKYHR